MTKNPAIRIAVAFYILQTISVLGFVERVIYGEWDGQGGNKIGQASNVLFIIVSIGLFAHAVPRWKPFRTLALLTLATGCFLLLSIAWSADPPASLRHGVNYMAVLLGAIGIAASLDADAYFSLLAGCCGFCAIASAAVLAVSPHLALMGGGEDGTFVVRGILSHKNSLGQVMAAGVLAGLHGVQTGRRRRVADLVMLGLFLALTFLSRSATSLLVILFYALVHLLLFLHRKNRTTRMLGWALMAGVAVTGAVAFLAPDLFLGLMGKDPTLTGRAELWEYVWRDIDLRPILGWGYAGFWTLNNPAAIDISTAVKWYVPQAHNGTLEILLCLGYAGFGLYASLLARQLWRGWHALPTASRAIATTALVSCGGIIILGTSETVLLEPYQVSTSIFFATGMLLDRSLWQTRMARRPAVVAHAGQGK